MGSRIKRRNKAINKMFAGKIPVEEARRRAGVPAVGKAAAADLVKAQQAQQARGFAGVDAVLARMAAEIAPRRPVTEADLLEATRTPMALPSAAKAARTEKRAGPAVPARREAPQQVLKAAGEMQAGAAMMLAMPGVPPMSSWTPVQRELWQQAHEHDDPQARSNAWSALKRELAGPEQAPAKTVRLLTRGVGTGGEWQPLTPPPGAGLRIAPPGTAGR